MSAAWQDLFVVAGGNATILAVLGLLCKSLLSQALARDIEKYKSQLKAETDVSIESLKSSLQMIALEHQVQFSNLHQKRCEIIEELYADLVDLLRLAEDFIHTQGNVNSTSQQIDEGKEDQTANKFVQVYSRFQRYRIYMSEPTCTLLNDLLTKARNACVEVSLFAPVEESVTKESSEQRANVLRNALLAFSKEVPPAKKAVEDEFRTLLGVEILDHKHRT